jgi:tetratricopeptide (TPR) repeat protein
MPEPQFKTTKDLVRALQLAKGDPAHADWGRAVFLIGAGCSRATGIPLGSEIAKCCIKRLSKIYSNGAAAFASENEFIPKDNRAGEQDAQDALRWLANNCEDFKAWKDVAPDWGAIYTQVFESHLESAVQQRDIITQAVHCGEGRVNWAHLCLGELVRLGYIHTVLTTNFDQLVLQGVLCTGLLPVVADGIESLNRISSHPALPQVVHLHGSMHTYNPRNSRTAVVETKEDLGLQSAMFGLLRDANLLVVVGYAGGEEGVMQLLIKAAERLPDAVIYWAMHGQQIAAESKYVGQLLSTHRHKYVIPDCDADQFFAAIMSGLGIGVPAWIREPVQHLQTSADAIADSSNADIQKLIAGHRQRIQDLLTCAQARPLAPETQLAAAAALRLQDKHAEALQILRSIRKAENTELLHMWADSAYELGCVSVESSLLQESIRVWRQLLPKIAKRDRSDNWAMEQNNLGSALAALGEREEGTARLEEAVAAYRAALEVRTRDRVPLDWAMTQNNLAAVLVTLGEREEGTARLEQAIAAFRAVLEVRMRDRVPLDWARTQNNLGNALARLAEREKGTARLEEAVAAYRAALEVHTRDRAPLNWAMEQNNLGFALRVLGEREEGTARLEEAVAAFRAALEVHTRDRVPLNWAMTQNNLGGTLAKLGEREEGTARLEEAAAALRGVLEVYTRDRVPLDWAMTQHNLGAVLVTLGEREKGTARLEEAVAAFRAALEVHARNRMPLNWAATQNNLGNVLARLGEREEGAARLEEAVAAFRAALEVHTRDRMPLDWAATQNNLGTTLAVLGEREEGTARLEEAVAALRNALEGYRQVGAQYYVSNATRNLQKVEAALKAKQTAPRK